MDRKGEKEREREREKEKIGGERDINLQLHKKINC